MIGSEAPGFHAWNGSGWNVQDPAQLVLYQAWNGPPWERSSYLEGRTSGGPAGKGRIDDCSRARWLSWPLSVSPRPPLSQGPGAPPSGTAGPPEERRVYVVFFEEKPLATYRGNHPRPGSHPSAQPWGAPARPGQRRRAGPTYDSWSAGRITG